MSSKLNIEYMAIENLVPYINNPRHNEKAVDVVAGSIKEFGFKNPIIIDKDNVIIAGHTRLMASRKLGITEVPVIRVEDLTEQQIKAFRIADNKTAEYAGWDNELLALELADIGEIFTGFAAAEINEITGHYDTVEDNYTEDPPTSPKTKYGQVYQLGEHRLMVGDATKPEDLKKLMGGAIADGIITDPPYNVNYESSSNMTILNDHKNNDDFRQFLIDAFKSADSVLKPGGAFYIWHADSEGLNFRGACFDIGWQVRQCIIWVKNSLVLGRQDYHWKHEPCLYGWKEGAAHYFTKDRTQETVIEDQIDIDKLKKDEMREILRKILSEETPTTVIHENKPARNDVHPTMKPIKLLAHLVGNSFRKNDLILDPFGGSGSTLMTCEQMHRKCYTLELDPKYADVIIDRWETFTGKKAVKLEVET